VVDNVANLIIAGELREGDTVQVDVGPDDRLVASRVEPLFVESTVEPDSVE
jgi:ATP-dependent Clp protease ATP-binding subunit ClpB